jgi:hypothetical protein
MFASVPIEIDCGSDRTRCLFEKPNNYINTIVLETDSTKFMVQITVLPCESPANSFAEINEEEWGIVGNRYALHRERKAMRSLTRRKEAKEI